jgi:hypothetical protein
MAFYETQFLTYLSERWQSLSERVRLAAIVVLLAVAVTPGMVSADPVIREIRINREPVFTDEDLYQIPWLPLGLVNRFHVDTRINVIRRELLFSEGDELDEEILAETERKLREAGIFAEAEISVVSAPGDSVDVVVRTRELWTTALNVAYDRFENDTLWTVELKEKNFLGMAKGFEFARRADPDRDTWIVGVNDRQMIDGTWDGRLRWADASDGSSIEWALNREFVQLTGKWAVRMGYRDSQFAPRYYVAENLYVRPDVRRTGAGFEFGRSLGINRHAVWRGLVGVELEHQNFQSQAPLNLHTPSTELPITVEFPSDVPEDRDWNSVYLGLEHRTRRFSRTRFLYAMGTREDLPLGLQWVVRAGWTARWLGSSDSGMMLRLEQSWIERISDHWLQSVRLEGSGLVGGGEGQNLQLLASAAQYHQPIDQVTVAWGLVGGIADDIDRSRVFHLGLDSGLRAARYRELSGDRLLRGNMEIRLTKTSGMFRLLTPGIVVFTDFGTAWFEQSRNFSWDQVRGAYGVGLRLGFNRAAADVPIRVDFAWPMLYPTEQPSPVISIGTGQLF